MGALLLFLITALTSFIGSLQVGLVNTAVLARTLQAGAREGRKVALGGALPELLYAGLAFGGSTLIDRFLDEHATLVRWIGAAFLIGYGANILFRSDPLINTSTTTNARGGFLKGLFLGLLNPQLILFWCGVIVALAASGQHPEGYTDLLAFAFGAFAGALALLLLLVALAERIQQRASPAALRMGFRVLGLLLMVAGGSLVLR